MNATSLSFPWVGSASDNDIAGVVCFDHVPDPTANRLFVSCHPILTTSRLSLWASYIECWGSESSMPKEFAVTVFTFILPHVNNNNLIIIILLLLLFVVFEAATPSFPLGLHVSYVLNCVNAVLSNRQTRTCTVIGLFWLGLREAPVQHGGPQAVRVWVDGLNVHLAPETLVYYVHAWAPAAAARLAEAGLPIFLKKHFRPKPEASLRTGACEGRGSDHPGSRGADLIFWILATL